jgi:uncharacterized protein (DUF927 family)
MKEEYHIIIIILLVIIIGLLIYHMMHNKHSEKIENFNYNTNGYSAKIESKDCAKWADYGECTTNWHYMVNKCPKYCPDQVKDVQKHNKKCKQWKNEGYCHKKKEKEYMNKQCPGYCDSKYTVSECDRIHSDTPIFL